MIGEYLHLSKVLRNFTNMLQTGKEHERRHFLLLGETQNTIWQACQANHLSAGISDFPATASLYSSSSQRGKTERWQTHSPLLTTHLAQGTLTLWFPTSKTEHPSDKISITPFTSLSNCSSFAPNNEFCIWSRSPGRYFKIIVFILQMGNAAT